MKRLLLLALVCMASLHAMEEQISFTIRALNTGKIAEHKTSIARNCFIKKYAQYGVKCGGGIAGLYVLYNIFVSRSISLPTSSTGPVTREDLNRLLARITVLEKMQNIRPKQSWFGWAKGMTASTINWVLPFAGYSFISHKVDKVLQPDTIDIFIHSQTKMPQIFNKMISYAQGFDESFSFELEKKQVYARALVIATNAIVASLERVIAFMEYKADSFDAQHALDATLDIRCLQKETNQVVQRLQDDLTQHFEQPEESKTHVQEMVDAFKTEFERLASHFGMIESEME